MEEIKLNLDLYTIEQLEYLIISIQDSEPLVADKIQKFLWQKASE